ncbi:acetyltransferase [Streptomyces phage BroPlease]|nr:acetyltransferase [Streptomyces phage BroPlease]
MSIFEIPALTLSDVRPASPNLYRAALAAARADSPRIADATSTPDEMPDDARYYLTADGLSGFGVAAHGDLIGLFSRVKGRGASLVQAAIDRGAVSLDCFDGFLPDYYAGFGFQETERVANWTPGGPDVVFMSLRV